MLDIDCEFYLNIFSDCTFYQLLWFNFKKLFRLSFMRQIKTPTGERASIIIDNLVECFGLDNSLIEINTLKLRINDQAKIKYLELKNFGFIKKDA